MSVRSGPAPPRLSSAQVCRKGSGDVVVLVVVVVVVIVAIVFSKVVAKPKTQVRTLQDLAPKELPHPS